MTWYITTLEDLTDHLTTNFLTALMPDPKVNSEDIIDPILEVYKNQGSKLSDEKYNRLNYITFEKLLASSIVSERTGRTSSLKQEELASR